MRFRKINKKGDVRTLAPTELVGYVLAGAVIIVIILVASIFTILYFNEKDKEAAINNFLALAHAVEVISDSRHQFDFQVGFPFYLPPDFIVVGFNKQWDNHYTSDGCQPEAVRKPEKRDGKEGAKCENSACMCLLGNAQNLMDGDNYNVELIECYSLAGIDYIISPYLGTSKDKKPGEDSGYPVGVWANLDGERIRLQKQDYADIDNGLNDYAFFYIYGRCGDYYWGANLGSVKLYLEKFRDEKGKTYAYIGPDYGSETMIVHRRFAAMNSKYGKLAISEYIKRMNSVFDKEARGDIVTDAEKLEAINSFVRLSYYYGTPDEIKPYLTKMAALYLEYESSLFGPFSDEQKAYLRRQLEPIIQSLEVFKSSAQGENKTKSEFYISRLSYLKHSDEGTRKAVLEMQQVMEDNNEKEKRFIIPSDSTYCGNYDKDIMQNKNVNIQSLLACAHYLLYKEYDVEHMLVFAKVGEEFSIETYKMKVLSVKTAEEVTIKIYEYNNSTKQYEPKMCKGKDELKISPRDHYGNTAVYDSENHYFNPDEYNPDIESSYSLWNVIVQDCYGVRT